MMLSYHGICSIIYYAILLMCLIFLKLKRKKENAFLFFVFIFGVYISAIINYTQFPFFIGSDLQKDMGFDGDVWGQIHLIPFVNLVAEDFKTSFLNVILTIPFGFLLPLIKKVKLQQIAIYGLLFTSSIEIMQLILGLVVGDTIRVIDINDIIFNELGILIGYFVFWIFSKLFNYITKHYKLDLNNLLQYIAEKCQ